MKNIWTAAATTFALAAIVGIPVAAQQSASSFAAARQANYKEIGGAFKTINDELRSGSPDMNALRPAAKDVAQRAAMSLKQFPKGSGPGAGTRTRAKAAIWKNFADFSKIQTEMVAAANALNTAAGSRDIAAMRAARDRLGATCKSCHDKYREPS